MKGLDQLSVAVRPSWVSVYACDRLPPHHVIIVPCMLPARGTAATPCARKGWHHHCSQDAARNLHIIHLAPRPKHLHHIPPVSLCAPTPTKLEPTPTKSQYHNGSQPCTHTHAHVHTTTRTCAHKHMRTRAPTHTQSHTHASSPPCCINIYTLQGSEATQLENAFEHWPRGG